MDVLSTLGDFVPRVVTFGFAAVGFTYLSFKLLSLLRLFLSLIAPGQTLRAYGPPGTWAVITGASDGIGAEYARQLAERRFNLVLISRTASKLDALSTEIQEENSDVKIRVHAMDFAKNLDKDYAAVENLIKDIPIGILINNVGVSHSIPVSFCETTEEEIHDIVTVNIFATLRMTKIVAPKLVAHRCGIILTMASFGGIVPSPLLATYSGSKAFLQHWSSALGAELASSNIRVQLTQSYLVTSAMSKIRKPSLLIPTPAAFVRSVLANVEKSAGSQGIAYTCTPYWSHAIVQWALGTFIGTMNTFVVGRNLAMHRNIRKRALKKQEREKKST